MKTWLVGSVATAALMAAQAGAQTAAPVQAPDTTRGVSAPSVDAGADAQTSQPTNTDAAAPGDIIVTAQKRSERLQEVPIAVSVVGGDAIALQGRSSIEGAQYLVPSLNFLKSGTTLNQSIFLRGVGTATFSIAGEPSVSTVVDGVVFSRAGEAFSDLVDIDRMEVLRGPQGTLFGKNASAGVINIVSKQPTRTLGGFAEASYFSRADYRGRVVLNLPLGDNLLTRFTGFYENYDGNIINTAHNRSHVNGFEHYGGRAQVVATPSSNVRLTLIADYHKNNDDCCGEVIGTGPIVAATGATTANPIFAVLPTPRGDRTRELAQNLVTATKETGYGFSGQIDVTLGDQTVTSITAYRKYDNTEIRDGDFLPSAYVGAGLNQLHDFGPQTSDTFSQELRLTSPGHQLLDYVIGAYYSRAYSERVFRRDDIVCAAAAGVTLTALTPCGAAGTAASTAPTGTADFGSTFKNLALFGQDTLNLTSRFRLIGGLRYTVDQLDVFHSRNTTLAGPGIQPSFPVTATGTGQPATVFRGKATNDNLSGKGAVQIDLTRNVTGYVSYTRGYKGPAFNVFYNLTATGTNVIAPETSTSYEAGLKSTLFGGRLVVNLDGFYAKYRNFQANNPDLVAGVVVTRFTNAGDVSTRGAEADVIWNPAPDLNITGGAAYTDAHVDNFFVAPGAATTAVVPPGTPLGFAPKFKGNLAVNYRYRTGGAVDFFAGAQGSYQSSELALFAPDPIQRQLGTIHAYGLVNLSAGIATRDDRLRITGQVRNLLDQSFAAAITNGGPAGSYRYQIPRDADRYYGVTARVGF